MKLILAEKPLAGERIARILGGRSVRKKFYKKHPYWEIDFNGPAVVVPLKGHIVDTDFPPEFSRWRLEDLEKMVDAPLREVETQKVIAELLRSLAPHVDSIIIATDYDREGEAIGIEAARIILRKKNAPVYRARFSSLSPDDVRAAFASLDRPDENLAEAAFTRRDVDLLWGAVLTRAFSLLLNRRGKDFLSVGRVQSPTLALVVQREKEIESFVPIPYWTLEAVMKKGVEFPATYIEKQIWSEFMAKQLHEKTKNAKTATVTRIERKEETVPRPVPFDTTTFVKEANARLGLSASEVMEIAEDLYMRGLISYPRTDNQSYPPNMDFKKILRTISPHPSFSHIISELLSQHVFKPSSGRKTEDHPPIHPVGYAELSGKKKQVYDLIVARFLATLLPPAVVHRTRVHFNVNGVPFISEGKRVVQKGWMAAYPSNVSESELPELAEGEEVSVVSVKLQKKKTKPPSRFTQGELIKRMEALGLGTKSTRPEIVAKLFARGYVSGKKRIAPTEKGRELYELLSRYAPDLTTHEMTARLEAEMDEIASGKKRRGDVVTDSRTLLKKVLHEVMANVGERDGTKT